MPLPEPNSPKVLVTALTEQEAALIVNQLDTLGIRADIWGAPSAGALPEGAFDFRVVVRQADLGRAKEGLDRIRRQRSERGANGAEGVG